MKYIRTKDGIYRVLQWGAKSKHYVICCNDSSQGKFDFDTNEIIKQADSIEKLCDRFVTLSKYSNRHYEFLTLKGAINKRKGLPFEVCEIYGAIWTDKGLIYVAKMNEKGELELL